ncbi:MAG: hypothetical protein AB1453_00320 [Chloroflexota bacterium]|jgi:hypothetical protein
MQILLSLPSIHLPLRCSRRVFRPGLIRPAHAYYFSAALRRRAQQHPARDLPIIFEESSVFQADLSAGKMRSPRL